ncbi:MAG: hypothetical protein IPO09_02255 [Anaeromyxobacter sp.]|nr:hypothetical protein [Anaeromyxobacter sp.]MBL0277544.1 hypothetical protein [Anaeromyxobacter sp.]
MTAGTLALLIASVSVATDGNPDLPAKLQPHLKVLGMTVGKDSVDGALKRLGKAEIAHNGLDAAAGARCACFVGSDGTALGLCSNSEGNGQSLRLTTIQLATTVSRLSFAPELPEEAVDVDVKRPKCSRLAGLSKTAGTAGGIHLGMSVADVVRALGDSGKRTKGVLQYGALPPEGSGYTKLTLHISGQLVDGIVAYMDRL